MQLNMGKANQHTLEPWGRTPYPDQISWIAPAGVRHRRGCVFRARKIALREQIDAKGAIQIAAESYYALYVNGRLAASGPARGTRTCNFLDTHCVAEHLTSGANHIAVEVFCNNFPSFHASPAEPALFLRSGDLVTNETWEVQAAEEYRTEDVEVYTLQIGLMEWRDQRKVPEGWTTFADASKWTAAEVLSPDRPIFAKALFFRDVPLLEEKEIRPKSVVMAKSLGPISTEITELALLLSTEPHHERTLDLSPLLKGLPATIAPLPNEGGVTFIVDLGMEFVGHVSFELDAPEGTILDVGYQEAVQNGRLLLNPTQYRFADRWILREGRQRIESPLRWRGGRFLQLALRQFDRPIHLHCLAIVDRRHPLTETATFSSDDEFSNDLWQRCLATLSACVTDTVTDCPWREMAFWVNDFLVVNRFWLQLVGTPEVLRRCLTLAISQRESNGLIGGVCPTDDNPFFTLYATNMFLAIALKDYLSHTGDHAFVSEVLPEIANLVTECERHAEGNGLLRPPEDLWNFVDWSYHFNDLSLQGKNSCVVNWFYVHALDSLASLFETCDPHRAEVYRHRATRIAIQIENIFWSPQDECFLEWLETDPTKTSPKASRLSHALALLSGRVSADRLPAVEQALFRDDLPLPELYMLHFVFEAMAQGGHWNEIHDLIRKHWGSILETDCPTIWEVNVYEHGKEAFANAASMCHAFALAPVNVLQRYVLGIHPLEAGFRRFAVAPNPGAMSQWQGTVPTPAGFIRIEGRRRASEIFLSLDVPPNCVAVLPDERELKAGRHTFSLPAGNPPSTRSHRRAADASHTGDPSLVGAESA